MSKDKLPFSALEKLVNNVLTSLPSRNQPGKPRGRPRTYKDSLLVTLWLYQTVHRLSYREVLRLAKRQGLSVPSLRAYHYRVHQLDPHLQRRLLEEVNKSLPQLT
jgi:hypothetical protein